MGEKGNKKVEGDIIDFVAKRQESIETKRRSFERVVFKNLLGVYSVISTNDSIYPLEMIDISHEGCLIQVPLNEKTDDKFKKGENLTFRMYFTEHSFIPVLVHIVYGKEVEGENGSIFMQYGCEFDQDTSSFAAIASFIDFVYKFAEHSVVDRDTQIQYFL